MDSALAVGKPAPPVTDTCGTGIGWEWVLGCLRGEHLQVLRMCPSCDRIAQAKNLYNPGEPRAAACVQCGGQMVPLSRRAYGGRTPETRGRSVEMS